MFVDSGQTIVDFCKKSVGFCRIWEHAGGYLWIFVKAQWMSVGLGQNPSDVCGFLTKSSRCLLFLVNILWMFVDFAQHRFVFS